MLTKLKSLKLGLKEVRMSLVAILLVMLGAMGGYQVGTSQGSAGVVGSIDVVGKNQIKQKADFGLFWQVWESLETSYLDPSKLDANEMVYGAIKGMTSALGDPYTAFLPPSENVQTKEDLAGEFAGVGIQLGYVEKTLAVMAPLPDQPAQKAGVRAGDLILHIKDEEKKIDKDTDGMSLVEAVQLIRGQKGKPVTLTLYTEGESATKEVTLLRDTIVVPSVELSFVNEKGEKDDSGKYAHLQVMKFGEKTMEEWNQSVNTILANKRVEGIILDVRDNPGGFLQRAIDLASEFIPSGTVVQQQGRTETETFAVNRRGKLIGKTVVILVNKGSASASEILAGALRDQLKTKLVGENTFGKGTVQEALELPGGAGLHVTIAKWLLPNGANIHGDGLKPDVEVKNVVQTEGETEIDEQLIKAIEVMNIRG